MAGNGIMYSASDIQWQPAVVTKHKRAEADQAAGRWVEAVCEAPYRWRNESRRVYIFPSSQIGILPSLSVSLSGELLLFHSESETLGGNQLRRRAEE